MMRYARGLAAAAVIVTLPAVAMASDDGRAYFASCGGCHNIGDVAGNSVGPALTNVFGARAGSQRGYDYSKALAEAGDNGLIWDRETLDAYIADPRGYIRGNRMAYAGQDDPEARRNIIDYLRDVARAGGDPFGEARTR